ncbi:vitellogenin-A1-like [Protopterus annectens]|uniref:vitellogenin-A1-like n=1 Tax=Protopterus annectens TaxID=7888 RepID=UPI001CFB011D|nr:vitellogenin-A1-like [Protopterus annectens]
MKAILLALTLTLVGGQSNIEPNFSRGKTYIYRYESVVLSGFPEGGLARSGVKINCKAEVGALDSHNYLLKVTAVLITMKLKNMK